MCIYIHILGHIAEKRSNKNMKRQHGGLSIKTNKRRTQEGKIQNV